MAIALDKGDLKISLLICADWSEKIPFFLNPIRFYQAMQEASVLFRYGTKVLEQFGTLTSCRISPAGSTINP
jgi:hypothetical protein